VTCPHPRRRTVDAAGKRAARAATDVCTANFNAIHFRWIDPLTQQIKETVALASPAENAVNICALIGIAGRAPNQLAALASASNMVGPSGSAGPKPGLAFTPGRSSVDNLRGRAVFVPGAVPAVMVEQSSLATLGQGILASLGLGDGSPDDDAEADAAEALGPAAGSKKRRGVRRCACLACFLVILVIIAVALVLIFEFPFILGLGRPDAAEDLSYLYSRNSSIPGPSSSGPSSSGPSSSGPSSSSSSVPSRKL
jgi:hypothetical protein